MQKFVYDKKSICAALSLTDAESRIIWRLDDIFDEVDLQRHRDLEGEGEIIYDLFTSCRSFEREYLNIAFALREGYSKVKTIAAAIAYLHTQCRANSFLVISDEDYMSAEVAQKISDSSNYSASYGKHPFIDKSELRIITGDALNTDKLSADFSGTTVCFATADELVAPSSLAREYLEAAKNPVVITPRAHLFRERTRHILNAIQPALGIELTVTDEQEGFYNIVYAE